jgi:hypothetical protein
MVCKRKISFTILAFKAFTTISAKRRTRPEIRELESTGCQILGMDKRIAAGLNNMKHSIASGG